MDEAIVVRDLHKRYGSIQAVNGVSFTVRKGEIFGILGPNGAGKTTTIEILEGLRKRDRGHVEVLGLDPDRKPFELRERIGVQFQSTSIQPRMKVGEALELFSSFYRKKGDVHRIVEALGLKERLQSYFQDLSGGWKQRVTLALAILHEPEIVFLDEPSTGLDPQARREMWEMIKGLKNGGKTVVLTTHYMEEAERLCDRVAMFAKGQLAACDSPKNLVARFMVSRCLVFESDDVQTEPLQTLSGVERVERDGSQLRVYCNDLQQVALQLFQLAHERQWKIEAFRFETGTLDDLFVELARKGESA